MSIKPSDSSPCKHSRNEQPSAKPYITHQLAIAGRSDPLFSDEVIEEIFQQSKGIPRIINNLCYACLLEIYQQNKSIVDTPTLEKVLIQWDLPLNI